MLTQGEVVRLLTGIANLKHRAMAMTLYAAGLRVAEVATLRIADIDSVRMLIHVRQGKGARDRIVPLAEQLLTVLRAYYCLDRPAHWLFPGQDRSRHINSRSIHGALAKASVATIGRRIHPHLLRHTCATHMLEAGVNIRIVQGFLGRLQGIGTSVAQRRALRVLLACRTARLGAHLDRCDTCEHRAISYNSCRNRHCPKCGASSRARWYEERRGDLLSVAYFHVVFTLLAELGPLALANKKTVYDMLFRAASETLPTIGADPRHLGAKVGFIALLHTWGQTLLHHPHLHVILPGGGLAPGRSRWIASRAGYFASIKVLAAVLRGKFLDYLARVHRTGDLRLLGVNEHLGRIEYVRALLSTL